MVYLNASTSSNFQETISRLSLDSFELFFLIICYCRRSSEDSYRTYSKIIQTQNSSEIRKFLRDPRRSSSRRSVYFCFCSVLFFQASYLKFPKDTQSLPALPWRDYVLVVIFSYLGKWHKRRNGAGELLPQDWWTFREWTRSPVRSSYRMCYNMS